MSEVFDSVKYKNEYAKTHYDQILLNFPKGSKQRMQKRAAELGCISKGKPSISAYMYRLYQQDILNHLLDNYVESEEKLF